MITQVTGQIALNVDKYIDLKKLLEARICNSLTLGLGLRIGSGYAPEKLGQTFVKRLCPRNIFDYVPDCYYFNSTCYFYL